MSSSVKTSSHLPATDVSNQGRRSRKATVWGIDFASGAIAATAAKTVSAPAERIKLLYQTRGSAYNSMGAVSLFNSLVRDQGVLSLWRGNIPNILRYFPMQAFMLTFKEEYRRQVFQFDFSQRHKMLASIVAGGLAGCTALTLVYPLDVARTRMAADVSKKGSSREFSSMADCVRKLYITHGLGNGLFGGYVAGLLCYFGYRGIQIGGYDYIKVSYGFDVKKHLKQAKNNQNSDASDGVFLFGLQRDFLACYGISLFFTCFGQTLVYPLDTIRRRGTVLCEIGMKRSTTEIYQEFGVNGFYRGLGVNYFRAFGSSLVLVLFDLVQPVVKQALLRED